MEGISLVLKVISCGDLKTFNFFQKPSVYTVVSIFIDEPKKNEQQRQKTPLDILNGVLKKNEKQQQRQKIPVNDETKKNELQAQQLLPRLKTPVDREGGSNPEWNHTMQFDLNTISHPNHGDRYLSLKFELRCEGVIFGKTIGEVCVPFKDLIDEFDGTVRFVSYQVRNCDGKPNGVLNFSYEVNRKVKKTRTEGPKVCLPPGIHFSSKRSHYPSLEVDVKSRKASLYPSLDGICSPSPETGELRNPVKSCYAMPLPPFPLQFPPPIAVSHNHQCPSPLTLTPCSCWYSTKTTDYDSSICGYPGDVNV